MKRFLPALALLLYVSAFAPSPARAWWWSHHHKSRGASSNASKPKKDKGEHLYNSPKSWGWFHKSPGPMGAGS